jgi:hypothetical protein
MYGTAGAVTTSNRGRGKSAKPRAHAPAARPSATAKALFAFGLHVDLGVARSVAIAVTGANPSYLSALLRATPGQLLRIEHGEMSLARLSIGKRIRNFNDAELEAALAEAPLDRVLDAADRMTAPFDLAEAPKANGAALPQLTHHSNS